MNDEMNYDAIDVTEDDGVEITELVPMDDDSDGSDGISAGEVAIGGLALIGAGFLIKKAYDGGKWVFNKIKAKLAKGSEDEAPEGEETEAPAEPETEATESVPEKEPPKGKGKQK